MPDRKVIDRGTDILVCPTATGGSTVHAYLTPLKTKAPVIVSGRDTSQIPKVQKPVPHMTGNSRNSTSAPSNSDDCLNTCIRRMYCDTTTLRCETASEYVSERSGLCCTVDVREGDNDMPLPIVDVFIKFVADPKNIGRLCDVVGEMPNIQFPALNGHVLWDTLATGKHLTS